MAPATKYDHRARKWVIRLSAVFVLTSALSFPGLSLSSEVKNSITMQAADAETGTKISREQAAQAALAALPGEVTDTTIEKKGGKMVYVVEIVAKKNGEETDVLVDMDSGEVLGME